MPSKPENYQEFEESRTARQRKLEKRIRPRGRRLVKKRKPQIEAASAQAARVDSAKQKITKHTELFPEFTTAEGRSQIERYMGWVAESLSHPQPVVREEDVKFKMAVASVKAGGQKRQKTRSSVRAIHLPTQISVKNEETRSKEQNKKAAYENLYSKLSEHLSLWQTLSQNLPDTYSASEIEDRGVDLLEDLVS